MSLRDIRQQQGLSIGELARRSGIDQALLSRYERGLRRPKDDKIRKLARALKVPVAAIREALDITAA